MRFLIDVNTHSIFPSTMFPKSSSSMWILTQCSHLWCSPKWIHREPTAEVSHWTWHLFRHIMNVQDWKSPGIISRQSLTIILSKLCVHGNKGKVWKGRKDHFWKHLCDFAPKALTSLTHYYDSATKCCLSLWSQIIWQQSTLFCSTIIIFYDFGDERHFVAES